MLFHSPGFLFVFLPLCLVTLYLMPRGSFRSIALLLFSYLFYSGAEPLFILILFASSITDYGVALRLHVTERTSVRRAWLGVSIFVNLSILAFFKYGGWAIPPIAPWIEMLGIPTPSSDFFDSYLLPAGISFYTFQSMAYTIDVFRKQVTPERSLLSFCNYVAYLPQLIAGPIERYSNLAPQLNSLTQGHTRPLWSAGIDRILLGIAQKLLLADSCGLIVDRLVAMNGPYDFITSWALGLAFGMQIYFDFAAYTHMAIGVSLLFGVKLSENFLSPYQATSIQDFWRRWHVTLSNWFRDYVYIPLGGSRVSSSRTVLNLLITFLLCGLWHGAGWNFIIWGLLHGCAIGIFNMKNRLLPDWRLPKVFAIGLTFACVHFIWIPFRVDDTVQIVEIWQGMLGLNGFSSSPLSDFDLLFIALVTAGTLLLPNASRRWPGYTGWKESAILASVALFAIFTSPVISQFIYFQF